ncbi:MAG: hypothetical protein FWE95_01325 [Planctomycetaceae bacterium]|nr:hypothetical protein [Planctomycetaceae bacterium]
MYSLSFPYQPKQLGMTLLEVILSLAILGGTVAIIGEIARAAFQNARSARDMIQAELLADSIMAKVRLGIIDMETAVEVPVGLNTTNLLDIIPDTHAVAEGNVADILWHYWLEVVEVDTVYDWEGNEICYLVEIAVTVRRNLPEARNPAVCRLVRWVTLEPEWEDDEEF